MNDNYNNYDCMGNKIKREVKSALFTYIFVSIFAKIFSLFFGGLIIGITYIISKIFRLTLTEGEKETIANKYREEDRQKAEMQNMIQYEQEIAELKEVKKAFEEEQILKKRMLEYRKSCGNN